MVLPQLVAFGRTGVEARLQVATLAEFFLHLDVNFLVDLELVERQFISIFKWPSSLSGRQRLNSRASLSPSCFPVGPGTYSGGACRRW